MNSCFRSIRLISAWLLLSFMAACGSGGGGDTGTPVLPPAVPVPTITTQPVAVSVVAGQPASFTVSTNAGPAPTFQWSRNGTAIAGATAATFGLTSTAVADSGSYTVLITNSAGTVTSAPAILSVAAANGPPVISAQPASATVGELTAPTFTVAAAGNGTLAYQWRKNGVDIAGANAASYTPPRLESRMPLAGASAPTFSVNVSNAFGAVNSTDAVLTVVRAAPVILVHPTNTTIPAGTNPSFLVQFSGSPPLTFQWQRNGVDIPLAVVTVTDPTIAFSYTVRDNTAVVNGSSYTVRVSNDLGSTVSNPALLTVTP